MGEAARASVFNTIAPEVHLTTHDVTKTSWFIPLWRAGLLAALATVALGATEAAKNPLTLKVQVNVPPTWSIFADDRISEMFVDGIRELLVRRGFAEPVDEVRFVEDPAKTPYLLTINLMEWRMQRTGAIDCTLTASLQTPRGVKHLGVYSHTSLYWRGSGRWALAREFDEAASGALNRLCDDIARTELLPGLRVRDRSREY